MRPMKGQRDYPEGQRVKLVLRMIEECLAERAKARRSFAASRRRTRVSTAPIFVQGNARSTPLILTCLTLARRAPELAPLIHRVNHLHAPSPAAAAQKSRARDTPNTYMRLPISTTMRTSYLGTGMSCALTHHSCHINDALRAHPL